MRLRVLGAVELVDADERSVEVPARQRRLLAALACCAGSVLPADRLADAIWGDGVPHHADSALHTLVSRLRARLGSEDRRVALLTRPPGYLLVVDGRALDASRFEELVGHARGELEASPSRALPLLDEALALWRGPAYAEFADEDFARAEAARLEELRVAAQEDRAEAALRLDDPAGALAGLEAVTSGHPLRERPHLQQTVALYRLGRHADALAVLDSYRRRLDEEAGLQPTTAWARLQEQVLRQDPALAVQAAAGGREQQGRPPARHRGRQPPAVGREAGPPPPLVGRAADLEGAGALLRPGALLTLTGPGGVGKTALARNLAAASDLADGARVVELAALAAPGPVAPAVCTILGVQQSGTDALERVVEFLRPLQLLLVLDNCEHVADAASEFVDAVHRYCSQVAVLCTSRVPLHVADEQLWPVRPLGRSPAVQLFAQRAARQEPTFTLDGPTAAAVAAVCERLDGLPLAIELAAARMGTMSPQDLLERLPWRFELLRGRQRGTEERHRALDSLVQWSFDLLDGRDREVLLALSVFAGSFTLDAVEAVVPPALSATPGQVGAGETVAAVLALVDRSLVTVVRSGQGGPRRYALLETVRAFARERLEEAGSRPDPDALRHVHAHWACGLAVAAEEQAFGPGYVRAVRRALESLDELRAAHVWALLADRPLAVRLVGAATTLVEHALLTEVGQWADRTLAVLDAPGAGAPPPGVARALLAAASTARFAGDLKRAHGLLLRSLATVAQDDVETQALAHFLLGEVALFEGRLSDAASEVEAVLAMRTAAGGLPRQAPMMEVVRPLLLAYRGETAAAARAAAQVRAEAAARGLEVVAAWGRYVEGEALLDDDPARAAALLDDALRLAREYGERYLEGVALVSAASVAARHGDPRSALPLYRDVVEHWHAAGDWTHQWTTLRGVADLLRRLDRDEDAAVLAGALRGRTATPALYGPDADRHEDLLAALALRLGPARLALLLADGERRTSDEVLAHVREALAAAVGEGPAARRQARR